MNTRFGLSDHLIKQNIDKGEFGLEKESLRINTYGFLSNTKHPFEESCNITRDFCENQIELITDVFDNVEDVLSHLQHLQTRVLQELQQLETGKEYLWPFSNPPYVKGEEDIPIAQFEGEQKSKTEYRNYLAEKYGKRKMLFSGIHLNYSFADEMLRAGYQVMQSVDIRSVLQREFPSYQSYKNHVYLQLAQKVTIYSWFIVYLTAASPVMDVSFIQCEKESKKDSVGIRPNEEKTVSSIIKQENWNADDLTKYASARCGEMGYWNDFTPVFDYQSLETYIQSIKNYIDCGRLKSASELYYPVRVKPQGENSLEHLKENGINHIELRMLDVNPLSSIGLIKEDVEFLHYFLLYLFVQKDIELTEEEQINAIFNEKQAAKFDDTQIFIQECNGDSKHIRKAALDILQDMEIYYTTLGEMKVLDSIRYQKDKLLIPGNRYADRIRREYETDYVKRGVSLADRYTKELLVGV